jgi:hypothetical protein
MRPQEAAPVQVAVALTRFTSISRHSASQLREPRYAAPMATNLRGGRPRKDSPRGIQLAAYLTEPESQAVRGVANALGVSTSELLRSSLLAYLRALVTQVAE